MDLDNAKERHSALKRKANEALSELISMGQSSSAKRKSQAQKLRDVAAYKAIIKTYKSPTWCGCAVSPRDLADFGWECIKKNTVKCVECGQVLSTVLPNILTASINVYNTSLKHIHEKMMTSHRPTCRQRAGSVPFHLVEPSSTEILDEIEKGLEAASSFSEEDMIVDIPNDVALPRLEKHSKPFVFASALGWKVAKSRRGYISLSCDHCARELIIKCGSKFDPVHNHERWCPKIDKNDNGEPFWQNNLNIVLNTKNKTLPQNTLPQTAAGMMKEVLSARRLLSNSISSIIPSYI